MEAMKRFFKTLTLFFNLFAVMSAFIRPLMTICYWKTRVGTCTNGNGLFLVKSFCSLSGLLETWFWPRDILELYQQIRFLVRWKSFAVAISRSM